MYTNLRVQNFRSLTQLNVETLGRLTLLTGRNGAGKTSVLEALFLLASPGHPSNAIKLNIFRGLVVITVDANRDAEMSWASLFPQFNTSLPIRIEGIRKTQGGPSTEMVAVRHAVASTLPREPNGALGTVTSTTEAGLPEIHMTVEGFEGLSGEYRLTVASDGMRETPGGAGLPFRCVFMHSRIDEGLAPVAERYSDLVARGREAEIVKAARLIEPDVRGLRLLSTSGMPVVHADVGGPHLIPLPLMGGGMWRLFALTVNLLWAGKDGLLLVDEFEYGVHYSVLPRMWELVDRLTAEHRVQLVATTHSRECVIAATSVQEAKLVKTSEDFAFLRMDRDSSGAVRAINYDAPTLRAALEGDLEVR